MTGEPVRIGVVGLGYWGPNLARNFAALGGCELRWCCDADPGNAEKAPPGTRVTTDLGELLADPELDAIVLACLQKDPNKRPQNAEELLRIAHNCRTCEGWTQVAAKSWWETHLPELTGPLTLGDDGPRTAAASAAAVH